VAGNRAELDAQAKVAELRRLIATLCASGGRSSA